MLLPHAPGFLANSVNEPPAEVALAEPVLLTDTFGWEEVQVAEALTSAVVWSELVTVALSCNGVPPAGIDVAPPAEVTTIDCGIAAVTVTTTALEVTPCQLAVSETPAGGVVAVPVSSPLTVTEKSAEVPHCTLPVRSAEVPSL